MKVGGIYKWSTPKARGHDSRQKYHVYIGSNHGKHVFLFINSENYFGEGFGLSRSDYAFFTNEMSFIGCTSVVVYSHFEIQNLSQNDFKGILLKRHIAELIQHVGVSEVMEPQHISFIIGSLKEQL